MTTHPFPVQLMASTHRRYVENAPGLLDLLVLNLATDSPITARIEVTGDMVGEWAGPRCLVTANGQTPLRIPTIPMPIGDYLLTVRVTLELDGGTTVCMCGQLDRMVEAKTNGPRDIHVNVNPSVSGTGFIDMSDFKTPPIPVHDVPKSDQPTYEEVILRQDILAGALSSCILEDAASQGRLHVLTGERITFGRSDEMADIIAPLPNDRVSRKHCSIVRTDDGFWVENLSGTNPPRVNDAEVRNRTGLSISEDSVLTLGGQATFHVHPIQSSIIDTMVLQHLSTHGIRCERLCDDGEAPAAMMITHEHTSASEPNLYLWLFQTVLLRDIPNLPSHAAGTALSSVPSLIAIDISDNGSVRSVNPVVNHGGVGRFVARMRQS